MLQARNRLFFSLTGRAWRLVALTRRTRWFLPLITGRSNSLIALRAFALADLLCCLLRGSLLCSLLLLDCCLLAAGLQNHCLFCCCQLLSHLLLRQLLRLFLGHDLSNALRL